MEEPDELKGKRAIYCADGSITAFSVRGNMRAAGLILVAETGNGSEAVELVVRERPDIVFIEDGVYAEKDGLETARQIMAQFPTCIVMLPVRSDREHLEKAIATGVSGYYIRPLETASLLFSTRRALQRFRERDR